MNKRITRGLLATGAALMCASFMATYMVDCNRSYINAFFGTSNTRTSLAGGKELTKDDIDSLFPYKSDYSSTKDLVQGLADVGERMSEEGTVLLRNEGNALPLNASEKKVTLLGTTAYNPIMGGQMGSGYQRNSNTDADTVSFFPALVKRGYSYQEGVQKAYSSAKAKPQAAPGASLSSTMTNNEVPLSDLQNQPTWPSDFGDYKTCLLMLGRHAGENATYLPGEKGVSKKDLALHQTDPLGLNDDERNLIKFAVEKKKAGQFTKIIILLNNASPMEIGELKDNEGIDSILELGLPGGYGFLGVADLLEGKVSPSGKLADTYAADISDAPSSYNYGGADFADLSSIEGNDATKGKMINSYEIEAEGIYAGYRYYETRYEDSVLLRNNAKSTKGSTSGEWDYEKEVTYPFGFGLSYTDFTQTLDSIEVSLEKKTISAAVTVTNTGTAAGKDAIELYVHAPYLEGGPEVSSIRLVDYGKTDLLQPKESKQYQLQADLQDIASWDSDFDNGDGTKGTYILNKGNYTFAIGNGAHEALNNVLLSNGLAQSQLSGTSSDHSTQIFPLSETDSTALSLSSTGEKVHNQIEDGDFNYYEPGTVKYLSRSDWEGSFPKTYSDLSTNAAMLKILLNDLTEIESNDDEKVTFGASNGLSLIDLRGVTDINDPRWSKLMDQITLQECLDRIAFGGSSCKTIASIGNPQVFQADGPNGYNNNTLGATVEGYTWLKEIDPCYFTSTDKNYKFNGGVMGTETLIGQTFSKEMASQYGAVTGNYSLWTHKTILWGAGLNLHRSPYNARNHEYYSEDPVLSGYQGASFIAAGNKYGAIISPKHFAFNDTEINRSGVAPFMTEQKARELELRSFQIGIEKGNAHGLMTSMSRIGATAINSHQGVMKNILHGEWGFKGLISTDATSNKYYTSMKEMALNYVTLTTMSEGDLTNGWEYWTVDNVSKDSRLTSAVKKCMLYQNYSIANSNAMNGFAKDLVFTHILTWYDKVMLSAEIVFSLVFAGALALYVINEIKAKKENH
jgi:beta-glucosidase